ncbi:MAG: ADP-ribosylglycohydrolase family protein [Nocardioides sp.]|nr:ADP-ribosylglycohydrolase family protein [Nocardioides sp.]
MTATPSVLTDDAASLDLHDRIVAGLAGAIIGDSMGTATETMTRRRVLEIYGRVTDFVPPEHSPFSGAQPMGTWSDDSSQMIMLLDRALERGSIQVDDVVAMLLEWAEDEERFLNQAGPTTREAIARLRAGEDPAVVGRGDVHNGTGVSNGAAMKAAPAGWFNPADPATAIEDAVTVSLPTHATQLAISGAAAVAAAVAEACRPGSDVDSVIEAGLHGVRVGEQRGIEVGSEAAGASVERRMREAVRIGREAEDVWSCLDELSDLVGSGLPTNEAVPAAFGLIAAARGDFVESVLGAVNVGNDADTVATIVGAIVGTLDGRASIPQAWFELVTSVNGLDLDDTAQRIVASRTSISPAQKRG